MYKYLMGGNGEEGTRLLSGTHWQAKWQWTQTEIQVIHEKKKKGGFGLVGWGVLFLAVVVCFYTL